MELIDKLLSKMNSNNSLLIKNLSEIICNNKIGVIGELKEYQNSKFLHNGKILSQEEQIDYCKDILESSIYEFDQLEYEDIQEYKKQKMIVDDKNSNNQDKKIALIKLFNITHKEMYFPYDAYSYIMDGIL